MAGKWGVLVERQKKGSRGSPPLPAFHTHPAAACPCKSCCNRQTEAAAGELGRKERIKDFVQALPADSGAGIRYLQAGVKSLQRLPIRGVKMKPPGSPVWNRGNRADQSERPAGARRDRRSVRTRSRADAGGPSCKLIKVVKTSYNPNRFYLMPNRLAALSCSHFLLTSSFNGSARTPSASSFIELPMKSQVEAKRIRSCRTEFPK